MCEVKTLRVSFLIDGNTHGGCSYLRLVLLISRDQSRTSLSVHEAAEAFSVLVDDTRISWLLFHFTIFGLLPLPNLPSHQFFRFLIWISKPTFLISFRVSFVVS